MSQEHGAAPSVTVREYARILWRYRWMILALALICSATAFGIAMTRPKVYRATATILAPKETGPQSLATSLGNLLGGGGKDGGGISLPGISVAAPQTTTNVDLFSALLRSRTMKDAVLEEFAKTWGPTVGPMVIGVESVVSRDRTTLSVSVEATHPKLAADVANAFFEALDRRLQRQAERDSWRQEVLYKAQLERAAKEVDVAEDALLKFQSENRLLAMDTSTKASVESGGSLRGTIMALELQREVMRMRYTDQHPQMREIEKQISELKKAYSKNLYGSAMDLPPESPTAKGSRKEFFVSADKMTPTQFAYLKLLRALKIQEAFYTGALQGLEQMRYATEVGRPQSIEPLDPALVPGKHVRPDILFVVFAAAVAGVVAGGAIALVREYMRLGHDAKARQRQTDPSAPPRLPVEASGPFGNGGGTAVPRPGAAV